MVTILTGAVARNNVKVKRQSQVIPCAPVKQAVVNATIKTKNTHSLLPSPLLM